MTLEEILGQQGVLGEAMNMEADTSGMTQAQIDDGIAKSRHDLFSQLGAMPVGAVEGMIGLPGDVERLGRGAFGAVTADNGNRWDSFLNELGNSDTTLPNTENIQNWTDNQLDGTAFGDMLKAGGDGRLIGEVLAPLPPLAGAVKYGGKGLDFLDDGVTAANKVLNRLDIQPGLSIKSVDNAYRPGYVYKTVNTVDGTKYIGSKLSPQGHSGKFFNENYYGSGSDLKKAIAEHGKDKFINVKEMDTRTVKGLIDAEEGLLKKLNVSQDPSFYNNQNTYGWGRNSAPSEVTKLKQSKALTGRPFTAEHKANISKAKVGKPALNKGKPSGRKGIPHTPIQKEKMREAALKMTDEHKAKIGSSNRTRNIGNKLGVTGVNKLPSGKYNARIGFNKKTKTKAFDTIEEAVAWRESMLNDYNKGVL